MQALATTRISFEARNEFDDLMTFVLERDY
jgi:hypothetical protein